MTGNHISVRHILESKLREAAPTHGMRVSIHIHQVADAVDITQQAVETEMAVHKLDRDTALIRQLRSAIERLDDGSYGICLKCEEDIAPKRLKAIPWAELCIHCQEMSDSRIAKTERSSMTMDDAA